MSFLTSKLGGDGNKEPKTDAMNALAQSIGTSGMEQGQNFAGDGVSSYSTQQMQAPQQQPQPRQLVESPLMQIITGASSIEQQYNPMLQMLLNSRRL